MRLDRKLNLVLTVERDDGPALHVHAAPIGQAVFESYFLTLTKAYAAMVQNGGAWMLSQGPRVAALMIRRIAEADQTWETAKDPVTGQPYPGASLGVRDGLVAEVRRLANVLAPREGGGWETIPLETAVQRQFLTPDDEREVENAISFFTCCCVSMTRKEADSLLSAAFGMFGAAVTSSDCTAFQASLPTWTPAGSIGEKAKPSPTPASDGSVEKALPI